MAQSDRVRDVLREHHERFAGTSSRRLSTFVNGEGASSYALLARSVSSPSVRDLLDVGCGDGGLLELLADAMPAARLVGIDLSQAELAHARARVPTATLLEADCTTCFPFEDRRFDAVVSHLVLMLVGEIDATFGEIARVLKRGGTFAFVYDDLDDARGGAYVDLLREALAAAGRDASVGFHSAADARLYDRVTLQDTLREYGFELREHRRFSVSAALDSERLWQLMHASYPLGMLEGERLEAARAAVLARVGDEYLQMNVPVQLVVAERTT